MNRVYDGIMGLVVGDALGVPVEFCERDTFCVTDMTGGGTHGLPAGTWSDNGSLALATLESLGRRRRIDLRDIMDNFVRWYAHNEFTPYHSVFDIGNTTRKAIGLYMQGVGVESCGGRSVADNGNGSLMRILPLAFVPHTDEDVAAVSALTHAHPISTGACEEYVRIAELLLAGGGPEEAARLYDDEYDIRKKPRAEVRSGGYVLDTLDAAVWCFATTSSYRECVLKAVNLGGDTDTTAAVAGGLAGIYYGSSGGRGIPQEWQAQIARGEWIAELCEADFFNGAAR